MKKKTTVVMAILTAAALFVGCGAKKSVEIDASALANDLLSNVTFEEELNQLPDPAVANYIDVVDGASVVMYMGSGSTAEEIVIVTAEDTAGADAMKANVEAFLADQSESFRDYIPAECDRIDNAVIVEEGNYVILCVCGDPSEAQAVIDGYLQ